MWHCGEGVLFAQFAEGLLCGRPAAAIGHLLWHGLFTHKAATFEQVAALCRTKPAEALLLTCALVLCIHP